MSVCYFFNYVPANLKKIRTTAKRRYYITKMINDVQSSIKFWDSMAHEYRFKYINASEETIANQETIANHNKKMYSAALNAIKDRKKIIKELQAILINLD